jgi:hypothetical protein
MKYADAVSRISDPMTQASIDAMKALRDVTLRSLQTAIEAHQRLLDDQKHMSVNDDETQSVKTLQARIKKLQSNVSFSQQKLENLKIAVNNFVMRMQKAQETSQAHSTIVTQKILRLRIINEEHVFETQRLCEKVNALRTLLEEQNKRVDGLFTQV